LEVKTSTSAHAATSADTSGKVKWVTNAVRGQFLHPLEKSVQLGERAALEIAAHVVEADFNSAEDTTIAAAIARTRQRSEQTRAPQVEPSC
jgi:hypothetical protein